MSEYTSTHEGFQRAMEWSLTGRPEESNLYVESTSTPTFYHVMNGQRLPYDTYLKGIVEWRAKISDYKPVVDEFLRDGEKLAVHMTGTIKVEGTETEFESFMFAKVDRETGKMEWLVERAIVASAITLYYRVTAFLGAQTSVVGQMLGQTIEISIAIIVGCVPAIRSLWRTHIAGTPFYLKLQSTFTGQSSRDLPQLRKPQVTSSDPLESSSHAYVELDEPPRAPSASNSNESRTWAHPHYEV
ncbi:hypothetical protein NUW58_g2489 [Xylaria curta]|uniref:Uncharacterized protein n=1 Tax=Xylaria curta TaxID=42375 RepID=A0ACC1PH29_9PEZI|nr:hypothetical protein NUW58_g2489 [Xylaria curta]